MICGAEDTSIITMQRSSSLLFYAKHLKLEATRDVYCANFIKLNSLFHTDSVDINILPIAVCINMLVFIYTK